MKKSSTLALVTLLMIVLLATSQAAMASNPTAVSTSGQSTIFGRVPANAAGSLEQLPFTAATAIDYGSFYWLEVTPSQLTQLQAEGVPFAVDSEAGMIQMTRYLFDPLAQGEPNIPAELQSEENGRGFHLVQFAGPIRAEWLTQMEEAGLPMLQYYPHNAYLTWGTSDQLSRVEGVSAVRWHGRVHPAYKLSETLDGRKGVIRNVNLIIYNDGQLDQTLKQVQELGGDLLQAFPSQPDLAFYDALLVMDAAVLPKVAQIPNVLWVGYIGDTPYHDDEMSSQIMAGNYDGSGVPFTGYNNYLANLGYTGAGITWAVIDSGVDYDHPDLNSRIVGGYNFAGCATPNPGDSSDDGHGTHVAGIIGGDANLGNTDSDGYLYGLGIAPAYSIFAMNPICNSASSWPPAGGWQENSKRAILGGAVGSNNSWTTGEGTAHGYQASERTHDVIVRDGNFDTAVVAEPIITVFSAGNSGPNPSTLTAPKEAKNIIVTAASNNFRAGSIDLLASFSSRGPAVDGRHGITVAAPGASIASTMSDTGGSCTTPIAGTSNRYSFCSGTSMAAPQVSGALALITEWWRTWNAGANPSPAMAKALLVNGAVDMGTADIPNANEGWGRVNVTNVISGSAPVLYYDQTNLLTDTGQQWTLNVGVADPAQPVKVTLVWSDAPGAVGANPSLVNNLDLVVVANSQPYLGNVFTSGWSATGGTADTRNNVENVYLTSVTGGVNITVNATNIAGDGVPYNGDTTDQDFALICTNCTLNEDFALSVTPPTQNVCASEAIYTVNVASI
ncbi:MAG: S8 family serine peptidase, partial [Anaerolineales bacterium]|nr:S8 family serine peptidase [Anaerolineales bacterium]